MSQIEIVSCPDAPKALGPYSHATVYGDLIFVSGIASRHPVTNQVPGLKLGPNREKLSYDIRAETRQTLETISNILQTAGSSLDRILEINVFLLDMKDFGAYNEVFAEFFPTHRPARTTVAVAGLPGDISIEMKAIAVRSR
jgi:2-aminomuconate deaminase